MSDTPRSLPRLARLILGKPAAPPVDAPETVAVAEERPIADMLAGCEYEIGQVARDVARTRTLPRSAGIAAHKPAQPFAIGLGLRNPDIRRTLAASKL